MTTNTIQSNPFASHLNGSMQENYRGTAQPASPAQIKTYLENCERKGIQPKDVATLTRSTISEEIGRIIALPFKASEAQMAKVMETIETLNNGGLKINISQEKLDSLTGGKNGTASQLLQFLFKKQEDAGIVGQPTEAQLNILVSWFLCPDIPFEAISIAHVYDKKDELANEQDSQTETINVSRATIIPRPDVSPKATQRILFTPEQFKEELKTKLNRNHASAIIDQYRATYYNWKKTRITDKQLKLIQTLDTRLASLYVPRETTLAVDESGNIVDTVAVKNSVYNPVAHEPLDMLQLAQMSYEEASTYIAQLQSALQDNSYADYASDDQAELNEKFATYNPDRNTGSRVKTREEARIKEFYAINDFLFSMDSLAGHEHTDMHETLRETIVDNGGEKSDEYTRKLKKMMIDSIDYSSKAKIYRSLARLESLTESSTILTAIYEMVEEDVTALA